MGGQKSSPLPKNWPENLIYLNSPFYSPHLTKSQITDSLRIKPKDDPDIFEIPRNLKPGPTAHVKITPVHNPSHPANGQAGLFAAKPLAPGTLILPYLGEIHPSDAEQHKQSDYDLWLDRNVDVAVDAARMGNEARFVNDYRGVPGHVRPNAEFRAVWDASRGEKGMAVFVLPSGKKAIQGKNTGGVGIAKGEEILVSYGKGFWGRRQEEQDNHNHKGEDAGEE